MWRFTHFPNLSIYPALRISEGFLRPQITILNTLALKVPTQYIQQPNESINRDLKKIVLKKTVSEKKRGKILGFLKIIEATEF